MDWFLWDKETNPLQDYWFKIRYLVTIFGDVPLAVDLGTVTQMFLNNPLSADFLKNVSLWVGYMYVSVYACMRVCEMRCSVWKFVVLTAFNFFRFTIISLLFRMSQDIISYYQMLSQSVKSSVSNLYVDSIDESNVFERPPLFVSSSFSSSYYYHHHHHHCVCTVVIFFVCRID